MNYVLSRAAGDLQHNSALGQNARKDIKYRALVAFRRWTAPFPVSCLQAPLLEHCAGPRRLTIQLSGPARRTFRAAEPAIYCEDGAGTLVIRPLQRVVRQHDYPPARTGRHLSDLAHHQDNEESGGRAHAFATALRLAQ